MCGHSVQTIATCIQDAICSIKMYIVVQTELRRRCLCQIHFHKIIHASTNTIIYVIQVMSQYQYGVRDTSWYLLTAFI